MRDELTAIDPEGADTYRDNYEAFASRLDALDAAVRDATATVPEEDRKLLTYHDSFPYFAREYGWDVVGAIQPSDFAEPTPREVARLIDQIRAEGIPAIFGEVFRVRSSSRSRQRRAPRTSTTSATTTCRARRATPSTATSA